MVRVPLMLLALVGCDGWMPKAPSAGAPPAPPTRPDLALSEAHPNVVVITLDTTRADRIGAWGYDKAQTDTIDALAARGRRYSRATSPLPLTIPSHASLFTGKYPPTLGIRANGEGLLQEAERTMAEVLYDAGYDTAASVAAFVTTRTWGFQQGFSAFFDEVPTDPENFWHGERPGASVVDDALTWVGAQPAGRPKLLWVHLYDAHFPYNPPEDYLARAEGRPYDGELAYVDDQVQRVVDAFAGQPTLFVVAADHGESLGEHQEMTHGLFTYDATQHVPLIIAGPGIPAEVVDTPTSLVDVLPTVLQAVGVQAPEGIEGKVVPSPTPHGPVYFESWQLGTRFGLAPHLGVIDGGYKLIDTPEPELYDLLADPAETTNLAADKADEVARLRALLKGFGYAPPAGDDPSTLDPSVAGELAALGYTASSGGRDLTQPMPDPKGHLGLVVDIQKVERKTMMRELDAAVEILKDLIQRYPDIVEFKSRLASLYGRQGKAKEARQLVAEALVLDPGNHSLRSAMAGHLAAEGNFDEAAVQFQQLAEDLPYMPRVRTMAVTMLNSAGKGDIAIRQGLSWLDDHPDDASLAGAVGALLVGARRLTEAMPLLERGHAAKPPEFDVSYLLGAHALGGGDADAAAALFREEVEHYPKNVKAIVALARIELRRMDWAKAAEAADAALVITPKDAEMHHIKVLGLFNQEKWVEARAAVTAGLTADPGHPDLMLMDANLLVKEGKPDAGKARFEEAQTALATRAAAEAETAAAEKDEAAKRAEAARKAVEDNPLGLRPTTDADWSRGEIADEGPE